MWYILVSDNDGHQYVIPEDKSNDWHDVWMDSEEYALGDLPEYAEKIEGNFRFREYEA